MADVNAVISLGIGSPADIPHFILVGLSINDDVAPDVTSGITLTGSFTQSISLTGSYAPSISLTGSVE